MQIIETPYNFELIFDYNVRIIAAIKAIPGKYWNPGNKCWCIPLSQRNAVEVLAKKYNVIPAGSDQPENIGVIPELPELDIQIPLKRDLFPFQGKGVAYTLQKMGTGGVFIGDKPGLGKTSQAIAATVAAKSKCILIICPSTLKLNWQREFMDVAGMKSMIMADSVKNTWHVYHKTGLFNVFIVNFESLKKYFVASINKPADKPLKLNHIVFKDTINLFDTIIIDESHKCKDGSTQQAKFCMGITRQKRLVLCLSGTPVVNKPKDLVSQLHILGRLDQFGGYKYFMNRYCGGNGSGATNLRELNYKLCTTCFYQREKKDVLKELPDKIRQIVLCDITTRKEYNEALEDLANYLKKYKEKTDPEIQNSMRGEIMVQIMACKNISARGKLQDAIDQIDEVIESGEKIGVFIHQKEIAQALLKHYPGAVSVRGDDSMEARQAAVDSFQRDASTKIIICSIKAAGVGITLTAASRMMFIELPWHAADCDQCEDRFHRIGQKDSVQCGYLLGKDTIDEKIYEIIESKRLVANTITGSADDIQKEIIDKIANSLFNTQKLEAA